MSVAVPARLVRARLRGRSALLWALVAFVAGQAGFRLALHWQPVLADREYGRKLTFLRQQLEAHPGKPLVVMLGSSRAVTGFRPEALPALRTAAGQEPVVFNYAQTGAGPVMTLLCLHRLLAAGIRPDLVLVECWPVHWYVQYTTDDYLAQTDLINLSCVGWNAAKLLAQYSTNPRRLQRRWCRTQLVPLVANRRLLLSDHVPSWLPPSAQVEQRGQNLSPSGWQEVAEPDDPGTHERLLAYYHNIYAPHLERFQTEGISDRALRQTLELCRREGIAAAVVVLPEGTQFRSWYPPEAEAEVSAYLERLRRECRVPVVDARTWVAEGDFLDSHHLLPRGATVFSARLGTEFLQPLLGGTPGPGRDMHADATVQLPRYRE